MLTEKYDQFSIEDFASDNYFIEWCLHPNEERNAYWRQWIVAHSDKEAIVSEAHRTVILLHQAEKTKVQSTIKKEIWVNLETHINRKEEAELKPTAPIFTLKKWVAVAASLLLFFFIYQTVNSSSKTIEWTQRANHSDRIESIELSDGTVIDLHPNSSIEYSSLFGDKQREIILQGEAFFDVARDTSKPFLVYANKTITKVLGTSFLIKAVQGLKTVEVEVESGSVSVFAHTSTGSQGESTLLVFKKGVVEIPKPNYKINLLPNEKITFDTEEESMKKSIVEIPKMVKDLNTLAQYDFDNAPITEVFEMIEQAYGIQIIFNKENLKKCTISTTLGDSPMFTKIEMLCAALDLSYQEIDAVIYIEGDGCPK